MCQPLGEGGKSLLEMDLLARPPGHGLEMHEKSRPWGFREAAKDHFVGLRRGSERDP